MTCAFPYCVVAVSIRSETSRCTFDSETYLAWLELPRPYRLLSHSPAGELSYAYQESLSRQNWHRSGYKRTADRRCVPSCGASDAEAVQSLDHRCYSGAVPLRDGCSYAAQASASLEGPSRILRRHKVLSDEHLILEDLSVCLRCPFLFPYLRRWSHMGKDLLDIGGLNLFSLHTETSDSCAYSAHRGRLSARSVFFCCFDDNHLLHLQFQVHHWSTSSLQQLQLLEKPF